MEVSQEHGQDAVDGGEVGQGLVVILEGDHEVLQQITFDQTCQRCLTMYVRVESMYNRINNIADVRQL